MSTGGLDPLAAYAARLSHDLKNPLSGIRMSLELALEELGPDADPAVVELLQRAQHGVDRMDEVIDDAVASTRRD